MADAGVYGGYGPPARVIGGTDLNLDYPPGPQIWPAGLTWPLRTPERVFASDLNEQLSMPVAFLSRKPVFQGAQYASQSIPASILTPVTLDTEISDAWNMHNVYTDVSQILIPAWTNGVWLVQGSIPYTTTAAGAAYQVSILHNGTQYAAGEKISATGAGRITPAVADLISCATPDYLQLAAFQTTAGAVSTYVNTGSGPNQYYDSAYPVLTARWAAWSGTVPDGVCSLPSQTAISAAGAVIQPASSTTLAIPSPGTWTSLQEATSVQFNNDIRNSVLFLANIPYFRAVATGSPAGIGSGTAAQVTGMTATLDNWSKFNATTSTYTIPVSGDYLVGAQTGWPAQSASFSCSSIIHAVQSGTANSYPGQSSNGENVAAMVLRVLRFTAGDTIQMYGFQNFGSTLAPSANVSTRMFALWMSS
jgi:hypothetical protein